MAGLQRGYDAAVNVAHLPGEERRRPPFTCPSGASGPMFPASILATITPDLIKVANLPKVAQPGWDQRPFLLLGSGIQGPTAKFSTTDAADDPQPSLGTNWSPGCPKVTMMYPGQSAGFGIGRKSEIEPGRLHAAQKHSPGFASPASVSGQGAICWSISPLTVRHHDLVQTRLSRSPSTATNWRWPAICNFHPDDCSPSF